MKSKISIIEIVFSIIIACLIIGVITYLSLLIKNSISKDSTNIVASNIASSIIENIKSRNFEELEEYIENFSSVGVIKDVEDTKQELNIIGTEFEGKIFSTEIPKGYLVDIVLENAIEEFDIVKNVSIKVNYQKQEYNFDTTIQIENIAECNRPVILNDYFKDLNITVDEYNIIPIKFDNNQMSFVTTGFNDDTWYNYSNKDWAKVVIFPKDGDSIQDLFIHDGIINNNVNYNGYTLNILNYVYVWVPNFGIKDGKTYFRYGSTKRAIKWDFEYKDGNYLYLNKIGDEIKNYSDECSFDGINGVWVKYQDAENLYFKALENTKFGPLNLY